ncbi:MAG: Rpn family recombination-promoting nuclease/putative transposase [bacterium]|nr:Rpn family recombination-promoting nuclease/putative transposase [bacterium]
MDRIVSPHDKLFRKTWSIKSVAANFLENNLPEDVLKLADLSSLEICKDSFIEEELRDYFSDLLYKIRMKDVPGYIYFLFEHKSYIEKHIHLQVMEYKGKIWRLHLKQNPKDRLPVIVPLVMYHGKNKWNVGKRFSEMMEIPEGESGLSPYIPDFEFVLCDLTAYSDDEIRGDALSRAVMLLFKHIRDPDIMEKLPGIFSLLRDILDSEGGLRCFEAILRYVFSTVEDITAEKLRTVTEKSLSHKKGEFVMTLAEKLKNEGIQIGKEQGYKLGHQEGLCGAIELGLSIRFGDQSLKLMPYIWQIQDTDRLKSIMDAVKTAEDVSDIKAIIEN